MQKLKPEEAATFDAAIKLLNERDASDSADLLRQLVKPCGHWYLSDELASALRYRGVIIDADDMDDLLHLVVARLHDPKCTQRTD